MLGEEAQRYRHTHCAVPVPHSNLLCLKPALPYPKETQQVPKVKRGWLFPQGGLQGLDFFTWKTVLL